MKVDLSKCDVKHRRMLAEMISSNCIELEKLSHDSDAGVRDVLKSIIIPNCPRH